PVLYLLHYCVMFVRGIAVNLLNIHSPKNISRVAVKFLCGIIDIKNISTDGIDQEHGYALLFKQVTKLSFTGLEIIFRLLTTGRVKERENQSRNLACIVFDWG